MASDRGLCPEAVGPGAARSLVVLHERLCFVSRFVDCFLCPAGRLIDRSLTLQLFVICQFSSGSLGASLRLVHVACHTSTPFLARSGSSSRVPARGRLESSRPL